MSVSRGPISDDSPDHVNDDRCSPNRRRVSEREAAGIVSQPHLRREGSGEDDGWGGREDGVELGAEQGSDLVPPRELGGDDLARHGVLPGFVARPELLGRCVEEDGYRRPAVGASHLDPCGSPVVVEPERVDDRQQPPLHATGDDIVEHLERVRSRPLIALAGADQCSQAVRRHHVVVPEPCVRPGGLAGTGWADKYHERVGGDPGQFLGLGGRRVHGERIARPARARAGRQV